MERSDGDHNRVIRDAARNVLAPLGLVQKGRSRTWLDDRVWHVIVVEFQPSSWSKATSLNVGVTWLWWSKDYLSFDHGPSGPQIWESAGRPEFPERAQRLASLAGDRVMALRAEVGTVRAAAQVLARDPGPGWPHLHAGIAAGLVGDVARADHLLGNLGMPDARYDWQLAMIERAQELRKMLDRPAAFREDVASAIVSCRAALKLREQDEIEVLGSLG